MESNIDWFRIMKEVSYMLIRKEILFNLLWWRWITRFKKSISRSNRTKIWNNKRANHLQQTKVRKQANRIQAKLLLKIHKILKLHRLKKMQAQLQTKKLIALLPKNLLQAQSLINKSRVPLQNKNNRQNLQNKPLQKFWNNRQNKNLVRFHWPKALQRNKRVLRRAY